MDELVTVFRSADSGAQEDAAEIVKLLGDSGIQASLLDDNSPGVLAGAWEVQVRPSDAARADALIAENWEEEDEFSNPDESHDLDLVTVFRSVGTGMESESMSVKAMLDSNGIYCMVISDPRWPNLPAEVRVPRDREAEAKRLIESALAAGPAGADEAEFGTENDGTES